MIAPTPGATSRKIDADRWLTDQQHARLVGSWTDPRLGQIRFEDWVHEWEATTADLRPTTRALNLGIVRNYLIPRFKGWPIADIGPSDVKAMVAEEVAAGVLSASAVRRHGIILGVILEAAVSEGRIARNPRRGLKLPAETSRRMRFLEPEELARLADSIRPAHYRPLVLTAGYVGLRWGELAGLKVGHIDLLRRRIRVEEQLVEIGHDLTWGPPKTKAGIRTVSVPAGLIDILALHFATEPVKSSGLAFPTPSGKPMRRSNFRAVWVRALESVGLGSWVDCPDGKQRFVPKLRFHDLRHTAASLAIAQGAHPVAIKERLGHSSIAVTMDTYGGLFPRIDEAIAEGLDHVLRASVTASARPDTGEVLHLPTSEGG